MKKLSLLQLGCLLGVFASSAAYSQVFNMHDVDQGTAFPGGGYNVAAFGQGAYSDPGNNVWNGFDIPGGNPPSSYGYGGGFPNDPLYTGPLTAGNNPGNPYAHSRNGYWAPDSGGAVTPTLFVPNNATTSMGNAYSDSTLSPITVPVLVRGGDAFQFIGGSSVAGADVARQQPEWIFQSCAYVNAAHPGAGTAAAPLGSCVLSNVPPGRYNLYLYGANPGGTGGALFTVDSGAALSGIAQTVNPYGTAGSPLNNYLQGVDFVVFTNVTPDTDSTIHITWSPVSNPGSGLSEGDFNGLQLAPVSATPFFAQQPVTSIFAAGATATLSSAVVAAPAAAYQWYETNADTTVTKLNGDTSATLSFPNVGTGNAGSYFVTATSGATTITSTVAVLTVATTPSITSQFPAAGLTLVAGQTVTLTVSAAGANPATFNWYSNSVLVATTTGTPNTSPIYEGTTVAYAGTSSSSSFIAGPVAANCTLSCTVVNSYLPAGVSDTPISVTVIPQLTGTYDTTVLGLNPVGYWPLNETSGTVAINYSTNGPALNGVYPAVAACPLQQGVAGPSSLAAEPNNYGTQFSTQGTQDTADAQTGVVISDPALMNITSNVSVAMWVNQPITHGTYIQEVYGQADNTLIRYSVFGTSDAQMDFVDGGGDVTGGPALDDGLWHLWTATFNATNLTVITYLDGVQINTGVESGVPGNSTQVTCIGSAPDDTGRNFVGSVCRVANFAAVLTPAQVKALWDSAYGGIIAEPPASEYYTAGSSVSLTANVQGPYIQWYKGGTPGAPGTGTLVVNGTEPSGTVISGANTATLTFTPPSAGDFATYYVVVGNGATFASSTITAYSTAVTLAQLPVPSGVYDNAVLALNPIAYWPLNESSGNVAYNYSSTFGGALNGTLEQFANCPNLEGAAGPPFTGFGGNNFATAFSTADGITYVGTMNVTGGEAGTGVLINNTNLDFIGNETIAAWIKIPAGLSVGNQGYIYGQAGDGHLVDYGVGGGATSEPFVQIGGGGSTTSGPGLNDGNWHFMVLAYNHTNLTSTNYIDGTLNFTKTSTAESSTTSPTGLGCSTADTRNFNGLMCRVAVFSNVLTAAQVVNLYSQAGVPPFITLNPPALVVAESGSAVTLGNVASGGSAPVVNSWYYGTPGSGTLLSAGGRYTVTSSNLTINPVEAGDAGSYYVEAANSVSTAYTTVSVLTVSTAVTDEIFAGQSPTFSVAPGAASYAWYTNNGSGPKLDASATGSTYTLHSVTAALNNGETVYALINGTEYSVTNTVNVVAAPADPYPAAVLLDHPIAYFRLDEADNGTGNNGTVAHEYINGYNGLYQNNGTAADLVLGVAGFPYAPPLAANTDTAASFGTLGSGGVDATPAGPSNNFVGYIPTLDFSTAASNSPAYIPAEFSVEAWVYVTEGQHNGAIVAKGYGFGDGNTAAGFFEQFSLQASDVGSTGSRYDFCVRDALGNIASAETGSFYPGYQNPPGTAFLPGVAFWQHVVGVCDQANGVVRIFVDGVQAASGTISKSNGIMSTLVPVSIGAKQQENTSGNYDGQLNGYVDEVAIYNTALTTNQIQKHYFAAGIAPILTVQPTNVLSIGSLGYTNAPLGTSVTLTSLAFGSPTLQYQWYDYNNGGTPIAVNSSAEPGNTGANTPTLTLKNVSTINAGGTVNTIGTGTFFVKVSNAYGSTNSANVTISPVAGPPIIQTDLPQTTYALVGASVSFNMVMTGTFPQTNAWYYTPLNGATVQLQNAGRYTITAGETPSLAIANVTLADQGTYQIFITNSTSYPYSVSSTPSALVVELEPTFNGTGIGWSGVTGSGSASPFFPSNNALQITTAGVTSQDNAFWLNTPVYIGAFQASFTYGDFNTTYAADGSSFTIQNSAAGTNAVGGGDLAISGITPSVSLEFTLWGVGQDGVSGYGWGTNGASVEDSQTPEFLLNENPSTPGGYVADNQTKVMNITYIGGYLSLSVSNTTTANVGSTNFYVGDLTQILGTNVALIGFTGACGGYTMTQIFGDFTFTPIPTLSAVLTANNVVLTWPNATGLTGYVLQSSATVNGTYTTVSGTPPIVNGNYQVSVPVPTGAGAKFYRLYLP
jgi:hypothetical protein